jgi:hypothetical protein
MVKIIVLIGQTVHMVENSYCTLKLSCLFDIFERMYDIVTKNEVLINSKSSKTLYFHLYI